MVGQVARKSSRPKFKVKSPEMLSYVALNLIMLSNILTFYYTVIALVSSHHYPVVFAFHFIVVWSVRSITHITLFYFISHCVAPVLISGDLTIIFRRCNSCFGRHNFGRDDFRATWPVTARAHSPLHLLLSTTPTADPALVIGYCEVARDTESKFAPQSDSPIVC